MGRNPTCIDHILTNDLSNVSCNGIITYNISHHLPIFVLFEIDNLHPIEQTLKKKLFINDFTVSGFTNELRTLSRDIIANNTELGTPELYTKFHTSFKDMYDKWFTKSIKNKTNRNYLRKDWITIGLASSCKTKNDLYKKWCKNRTSKCWNEYVNYKRDLDKLLNKAKYDFYNREFNNCSTDLKKTWQTINNILGSRKVKH